jgi:hypothetical protein
VTVKLYLSGPINSDTPDGFNEDEHKEVFRKVKEWLEKEGHQGEIVDAAAIPTTCDKTICGPHEGHSWECWLRTDLAVLLQCDAICMLPFWAWSRGARLEAYIASALSMPAFEATRRSAKSEGWVIQPMNHLRAMMQGRG